MIQDRVSPTFARVVLAVAFALMAAACLQPSLNPLFLPENSVFEDALLGGWTCGSETWTFARDQDKDLGPKDFYRVSIDAGGKTGELIAWLGKIDKDLFVSFAGSSDQDTATRFLDRHMVGVFTFGRITIEQAKLTLAMLDGSWVDRAEKAGLLTIGVRRWPDDVILTAPPKDLERFAGAYADDPQVFGERIEFVRVRPGVPQPTGGSCYGN